MFVQGAEEGQGVLRSHDGRCFAVTPYHVVENAVPPITLIGEGGGRAAATLSRSNEAADLAVLELSPGHGLPCPAWEFRINLGPLLESQAGGVLRIREQDGSLTQVPVVFRALTSDHAIVAPTSVGDAIQEGMSGSSLVVRGAVAGILLSVRDGQGTVHRLDSVERSLYTIFHREDTDSVLAANLVADLAGQWRMYPFDEGITIERSGSEYVARFTGVSNRSDAGKIPTNGATIGDEVFRISSQIRSMHRRRYPYGWESPGSWVADFEVELLYQPLKTERGRCSPMYHKGISASVNVSTISGHKTMTIERVQTGYVDYDSDIYACYVKFIGNPRALKLDPEETAPSRPQR